MVRSDRLFGSEGARSSDVVFFQRGILIAVASVTVTEAGGGSAGTGKHSLPLILARELAANLATPMFLIDADGMLVYFNEAAELMLGRSFGEVGPMSGNEFGSALQLAELDGTPMRRRDSPAGVAFLRREPSHRSVLATSLDGTRRPFEVTAYPLFGKVGEMHGVLTVFWEAGE